MSLINWNNRLTRSAWSWRLLIAEALIVFAYLMALNAWWGINQLPAIGDAPEYENITFHLSQGEGLARGYSEAWIEPYLAAEPVKYAWLNKYQKMATGPSAYRPPLQPAIMASTYQVFGRNYWPMRCLNGLALAISILIAAWLTRKQFGVIPSWIVLFLLLIDPRFVEFAHRLLTESWAVLFTLLIAYSLIRATTTKSNYWYGCVGLFYGLAILSRTSFVLWFPLLLILFLLDGKEKRIFQPLKQLVVPVGIFVLAFLIIAGPWFAWNCHISQSFKPLGTHGWINLPVAYSDQILANGGVFPSEYARELQEDSFVKPADWTQLTPIEQEVLLANHGRQIAVDWVQANPRKVPLLFAKKMFACFMYDRSLFSLLGIPFLFGACYWLRTYQGRICVGLIACQFFSVGLTWSTSGRFQVPIRPLFCIAAAIGIWLMIVCIMDSKFLKLAFPEQKNDS